MSVYIYILYMYPFLVSLSLNHLLYLRLQLWLFNNLLCSQQQQQLSKAHMDFSSIRFAMASGITTPCLWSSPKFSSTSMAALWLPARITLKLLTIGRFTTVTDSTQL